MRRVVILLLSFSRCLVYAREQRVLRAGAVPILCSYFDEDGIEHHDGECTSYTECPVERYYYPVERYSYGGWYVTKPPSLTLFFV